MPSVPPRDLGGAFSLNLLIETDAGRYVARVHGTQTEPERLEAVQRARRHLAAGGVPAPEQVLASDGASFVVVGGHRLELGLPYLGRTQSLLRSLQVGEVGRRAPIANHIEPAEALAGTLRGVQRMRSWNPTADELNLAIWSEELAYLVHDAERDAVSGLPRQLVHGDFWDNNVLFLGDAVVLVTDLDFMGERLRIDDLALTLFFANSTIGGDRLSGDRIRQMRTLVDAYDSGLSDHLSPAERRALPAAIARQTLWSVGFWVPALPEERARKHAAASEVDVEWTLVLMRNAEEWQEAFTAGASDDR
jgi:homoserine kinase type II